MDAADAAAERLAAGLTDEEFFWQPDEGRWSVAQCLDHLAVTNAIYGRGMADGVAAARERGWARTGPVRPGFFGQKFAASLEPPVKRRTRTPGRIQPRMVRARDEALAAYRSAHDEIRRLLRDAAALDVNRATFPNPFLPLLRVKVSSAFHVIAAHDRRHLWQAEQVERAIRGRQRI